MALLSTSGNPKLEKSDNKQLGFLTAGLNLAAADTSGYEVCPSRSEGCSNVCLLYQGRGQMKSVMNARIKKTINFFEDRLPFKEQLYAEVSAFRRKAQRKGLTPVIRLNVMSDISWERQIPALFSDFPDIQYYDYTKQEHRMDAYLAGSKHWPANYSLCFSRSEKNEDYCRTVLQRGGTINVVFRDWFPLSFLGYPVIDGDEDDLTFLTPSHTVRAVIAKGSAKHDTTGFVVDATDKHMQSSWQRQKAEAIA